MMVEMVLIFVMNSLIQTMNQTFLPFIDKFFYTAW